jgi:hypothetical protein
VHRPYGGYAAILATFGGTVAATAVLERALRSHVRPPSALDFVLLSAGSFKAARAVSRERVGAVLRQPFVEPNGEGTEIALEQPAGEGLRRAIGELVTCTRCAGTWTAAALLASQAAAPRLGRILTWTLAAGAANDFLQAAFAALCARDGTASHADSEREQGLETQGMNHSGRHAAWTTKSTR